MVLVDHFKVGSYLDECLCSIKGIRFDCLDQRSVAVYINSLKVLDPCSQHADEAAKAVEGSHEMERSLLRGLIQDGIWVRAVLVHELEVGHILNLDEVLDPLPISPLDQMLFLLRLVEHFRAYLTL